MHPLLLAICFVNAIVLLLREMDSAYWEKWDLSGPPGGEPVFLRLHIPFYVFLLVGLLELGHRTQLGDFIALLVELAGLFAFGIHSCQRRSGVLAFSDPSSQKILWATLLLAVPEIAISLSDLLWPPTVG